MNATIEVADIVRPIGDDLHTAFFRVMRLSRNGWAACRCIAYADGLRPSPAAASAPKFRTSHLKRVESLPPAPLKIRIIVHSRERWLEVGTVSGWRTLLRDIRGRRACGLTAWQLLRTT